MSVSLSACAQAGSSIHLNKKAAIVTCVFIEVHKQARFICQADMVADSSLTPSVALLVCPRGTIHSIVDYHGFTGLQK